MRLGGKPLQFEFYDIKTDPHEMVNLAESVDHKAEFDRLSEALHKWAVGTEDTFITLRQPSG